MSNQDLVALIHTESERLKHYVNTLPQDAFEHLTPCEGWTVADVVAQLVWFAETYGGMMARGLRGDVSPLEGFPTAGAITGPDLEALYRQGAMARQQELSETLRPTFATTYDALNEMLNGIGLQDWDKPCYHPLGLRSVQSFLPTIVQELAVHEWDLRSCIEPSPSLSPESTPVLVAKHALNFYRPWRVSFPRNAGASNTLRYRFDLTGASADQWDIVVKGEKAHMEPPGETQADLCVRGDAGEFVLLLYGRLSLDSAIATGSFKAEGNVELIHDFDRWLEGH